MFKGGWETRSPGTRIQLSHYQTAYTVQNPQTIVAPQYYQPTYQTQSVQAPSENQVAATNTTSNSAPVATVAAATEAGDPYGFLGWLNATRASYGLPGVGYDPNLSSWAAMNNDQQAARGMGHFVMGPARGRTPPWVHSPTSVRCG